MMSTAPGNVLLLPPSARLPKPPRWTPCAKSSKPAQQANLKRSKTRLHTARAAVSAGHKLVSLLTSTSATKCLEPAELRMEGQSG